MKRYILYIIVFFASVVIVDFGFGKAADYMTFHARGGITKQFVDLCENDYYDILIMGSSKAHHNYIPQVFSDSLGLSCYNAGFDGNGIILAYGLLSLIDNERMPKLIIYDVKQQFDIYHYSNDGDYSRYYQKLKLFYGEPSINELIGGISRQDLWKLHSSLYRYNGDFLYTISDFLRSSQKDLNFGYTPLLGVITNDSEQEKDYSDNIDSLKIEYFQKFVNYTKEKGIDLMVVFSPEIYTPFQNDFQPIRDICATEKIIVIDHFADLAFLKKTYFKDHCHLNKDGAETFSAVLASEIKKIIQNKNEIQ